MELFLFLLQTVKWVTISAGVFGVAVVLLYTIDLLIEEWKLLSEKWQAAKPAFESIRVAHHKMHLKKSLEESAWAEYFFEDIGRHRVNKDAAFVHPYIAVRPRLYRYTIRMETVDA